MILTSAPACLIAPATLADAPAIAEIYEHHVLRGTATFEILPPDEGEIADRLRDLMDEGCPWLVARDAAGTIQGYAYARQLGTRAAYRFACENSIYLRHGEQGRGFGGALLSALIEACEEAGFRQMVALISDCPPKGSGASSVALHERAGFTHCGRMKSVGRKHGQWLDLIYMQRALGAGDGVAPEQEP